MLHLHAYVDIMFMHCNLHHVILSWLSIFAFKLNLIITQLEYIVDRVMVPLNRVFPSATTFAFIRSVVMPLVGASNKGRLCACGTLAR